MMFPRNSGKLKIAGDYRVNQSIDHFKIKIKIVQQKSPLVELFDSQEEIHDSNYLESEEKTITWQEKIFSSLEVKLYSEEKNCSTKIQKDYNEIIKNKSIQGSRLFTYTSDDAYHRDKSPVTKKNYKSLLSIKNEYALPTIKNRKPFNERYNKQVIDENPTDTKIRSNHYLYRDCTVMHIMVDLSSKDQAFPDPDTSEILLCTLTYNKAGKVLTIDPDINNDQDEAYSIESIGMNYDYWIEHVYEHSDDDVIVNNNLQHEIPEIYRQDKIISDIELPPANILRLFLTFDFIEARDFCYNSIFITYTIDLPKYWSTNNRDKLYGRTQRCRMINKSAHFSYLAEITLDLDLNCLNETVPSWPYLLISVGSFDNWTRYRIEGYTSMPLPSTSGSYEFRLQTWRPVYGIVNALRRFFTGGTAELEDITYCGIPRDHEGSKLDKKELKVVPSGTVDLRVNIIQQNNKIISKSRSKYQERLNSGMLINTVNNVLEQFKAARERMIQARSDRIHL
ncbi:tectonic-like complex member MKS1 [Microplitis demolitor]|uniref:tectonic-like complex member MKS1 n=1 Tax=Microplitis demolitor TaxID=69319 RepID=UPI0006D4F228|nr:tectonic-like complex member MKS1 [Microplitis demolitor]